jgi:hypothetical protein
MLYVDICNLFKMYFSNIYLTIHFNGAVTTARNRQVPFMNLTDKHWFVVQ